VLRWAKARSIPLLHGSMMEFAVVGGSIEVMEWLQAEGCPWSRNCHAAAVCSGDARVLAWVFAANPPTPYLMQECMDRVCNQPHVRDWLLAWRDARARDRTEGV
jgi:hypothetical protein